MLYFDALETAVPFDPPVAEPLPPPVDPTVDVLVWLV
jgi:hypothetical protein